jgi:predicted acylesterase/phospholipase RssA/CRP-like cAMP-binding protein
MTTQWTDLLRTHGLFRELPDESLAQLDRSFVERRVAAGADLVREGEVGESLYVILEGKLEVLLDELRLHDLGPGAIVGEVALLAGGRRTATVRALEPTRALVLTRERFESLLVSHPELRTTFSSEVQNRLRRVQIARHLEDLFGKLEPAALAQIEAEVTWKRVAGGEVLFEQGDAADGAYIVAVGRMRVSIGDRVIDEVSPGEWIGEMALITRSARSATVVAMRDSELVWLSQAAFDKLVIAHPTALLEASRQLVSRLQRQMTTSRSPIADVRTFAIVGTVETGEFAAQLAAELGGFGRVVHLTAERIDSELGKRGIANVRDGDPLALRLAPWLLEQEGAHRHVVYEASPTWTPWTERALRAADRILILVDGDGLPVKTELEERIAQLFAGGRPPPIDLILVHRERAAGFAGTARWLEHRDVDHHFHVRRDVPNDIARVARILDNRAIGLVFGGGGSRGYAHIGVVRAFEELGIPIDAVGGSSIGAVISGAYALGLGWEQMLSVCAPILARFLDPTLPFVALMSGRRATEGVASVSNGLEIEDLVTTMFCISTNLTRGGMVVHRRGDLALAARASGSVPGIFPPVPWHGDLLVDGGLTNNLPVDVMRSLIGGSVVAVDVIPDIDLQASGDLPNHLSGWSYAWHKVNPLATKIGMPNILSILMRSMMVASKDVLRAEEKTTSLYLRPPVNKWNMLDFKSAEPIAEQGYRGTVRAIEAWWAGVKRTHVRA